MKPFSLLRAILSLFVKDQGALIAGLVRFGKIAIIGFVVALAADQVWGASLTPLGLMLVTSGLAALEKATKDWLGVGL